ncbi:stimulated by retinoic acid gene 8 protein homolog [Ascaphus truei]|uniref:stimulated by retinoic acid gene 8 protein homolog n=1 Tax=Ascaphus truei TaxID=8439 RepID=UPI003F5975EB
MDAAGEGSSRTARRLPVLPSRRQERGEEAARRRPSRPPRRTPISQLISQLRETVFPDSDTPATKNQVLRQTKNYIQELEKNLDSLLKMKDSFHPEDRSPCSLEGVKDEYLRIYYSDHSTAPDTEPQSESESAVWYLTQKYERDPTEMGEGAKSDQAHSPVSSSPDVMEFERYLYFYKQTVDMLVENGIVSPEQVTHPVVSKAISHLRQDLLQEGKADILQGGSQQVRSAACSLPPYPNNTDCAEVCVSRDSGAESQEASGSFVSSTPEETLFEDAFDLAAGFLDHGIIQSESSPSSAHESSPWDSAGDSLLYRDIVGFLRARLCSCPQEAALQFDYETVLLRCTETFDDEDL